MERPVDISLPFFAYGLFKPGQLAYFQLQELVNEITDPAQIAGSLLLRDGLPIIDPTGQGLVKGVLMTFWPGRAVEAYDRISAMEPDNHYRWDRGQVNRTSANVLLGRYPRKGSVPCEEDEWDGWNDPLFTAALDVVEEALNSQTFDWDLKPLFRLQMAYLLLWSSIERYVSLRYHLGTDVTRKIEQLAHEPAFASSLLLHVKEHREVYRADRPDQKEVLDRLRPEKALKYFYQLRSNLTHRGKAVIRDHERIKDALAQLLPIFRDVLKVARSEAGIGGRVWRPSVLTQHGRKRPNC